MDNAALSRAIGFIAAADKRSMDQKVADLELDHTTATGLLNENGHLSDLIAQLERIAEQVEELNDGIGSWGLPSMLKGAADTLRNAVHDMDLKAVHSAISAKLDDYYSGPDTVAEDEGSMWRHTRGVGR